MNVIYKLFLLLIIAVPVFAQSNSAYTRKGVGDLVYSFSSRRLGMGQLGTAIPDEDFISTNNPASWYLLKRTRAEFSVDYSGIYASDNSAKKFYTEANFNGVTLAFPISSLYGISAALGIIPYSNVSYEVNENINSGSSIIGNYNSNSKGSGGVSKIFIGGSYLLPGSIAAGAAFDYYFGNLNYTETVTFPGSPNLQTVYPRKYSLRGIGGTFGAISPDFSSILNSESFTNLRFGASLNIIRPLSVDTSLISSSINSSSVLHLDTLGSGNVKMNIPYRLNTGISFNVNKVYLFSLDYLYQPWSRYEFNEKTSEELVDLHKISAGFEYRPSRELGASFWQQIIFRAALGYERSQYYLNGENIQQLSIFGGMSIPFSIENTLDIGIQFAVRGTTESNLVEENMIKLNLGLSLGEIWFIREEK